MNDFNDDIARYLSGRMSPAEMHALEKRALDDPFLADALAGGESIPEASFSEDMAHLQQLLQHRVKKEPTVAIPDTATTPRGKQVSIWTWPTSIAAGLLLVASAGVVLYFLSGQRDEHLAMTTAPMQKSEPTLRATDSILSDQAQAFTDETVADGDNKAKNNAQAVIGEDKAKRSGSVLSEPKQEQSVSALQQSELPGKGTARTSGTTPAADDKSDISQEELARPLAGNSSRISAVRPDEVRPAEAPAEVVIESERAAESAARNTDSDVREIDEKLRREIVARQAQANVDVSDKKDAEAPYAAKKESEVSQPAAASPIAMEVYAGKVVDADGAGIPGVNVLIKGTNTGTVTDVQGNYQLSVSDAHPTLVYTFIGYSSREEVAETSQPATIQLEEDLTQLSEVVVAGYGAQRTDEPVNPMFDFAYPSGGKRAFKQYLEKSMQYPKEALVNQVEGKVTIQFTVETTGSLSDFRVIKGIGSGCDQEVIRLIKTGPKWNPTRRDEVAEKSTIKVRMRFQLPTKKK